MAFDLDGVLSKGEVFPKTTDFDELLHGQIKNLNQLSRFLKAKGIISIAITGRSLDITKPIIDKYMTGPSACEHGAVIYNPATFQHYHIADSDSRFSNQINAKNELEQFIESADVISDDLILKFPNEGIKRLKENHHILTYEFKPSVSCDFSKDLFQYLQENHFPSIILGHIEEGLLSVIYSNSALDIKPNISKADAILHILRELDVLEEEVLVCGNSFHSDFDMMRVIPNGYWFGPANSDKKLKKAVKSHGSKGYISKGDYFQGTMETLPLILEDSNI